MHPVYEAPIGFMSSAHFTSSHEQAKLDALREHLETEVSNQTGDPFRIFQDRRDIQWGEAWQRRIESSIDNAAFLIPILTPAFFKSAHCRAELERFIRREQQLANNDLIRPIYYITCPELEGEQASEDQLLKALTTRQYIDCRKLRFSTPQSANYARKVAEIAEMLARAVRKSRDSSNYSDNQAVPTRAGSESVHPELKENNSPTISLSRFHPDLGCLGTG